LQPIVVGYCVRHVHEPILLLRADYLLESNRLRESAQLSGGLLV
jgi:hypothetical protein